ncbi:MAG TPA: hypothetical protein VHD62_04520 [Opitutaceae bacterium]|nr:hypothetical protein [Opitutaceae bacterium]
MNTPPAFGFFRSFRVLFVAAFALAAAFPVFAVDNELGESVGTVALPANVTPTEVKDAIVKAFTGREWGIKSQGSARVVGYLKHRSNEAQLTLVFDAQKVELFCLGWQIDKKTGAREKPELPKGWIGNIKSDLTKILNRITTTK